ncbi:hypothetical protein Hanom_Chr16g01467371 [Helianthus anomalus]
MLGMSGLGRICKKCTSLRTWSMIGARGDIGLRLRISRRGYNCVVCVIFVLFTMQSFTTHVILVASYTHTHTPHVLFISFLGVLEPRVSLEAASLSLGVEVRCAYISPSPDPTNSFAICGILLGMID